MIREEIRIDMSNGIRNIIYKLDSIIIDEIDEAKLVTLSSAKYYLPRYMERMNLDIKFSKSCWNYNISIPAID